MGPGRWDRALKRAYAANDPTRYKLDKAQEKVANETRTFTGLIHTNILDKSGIQIERDFYWDQASAAVEAQYELYDATATALDEMLVDQITALRTKRTTVLVSAVVAILLVALLQIAIFGDTIRRLRVATRTAREVATGDLSGTLTVYGRDEVAQVLRAFSEVRDRLRQFEQAQLAMAAAHETGDTDHRIDATSLPGAYGTLAGKVNELVDAHIDLNRRFIGVINEYARGEFAADMPQLPGKKAQITDVAFSVKRSLSAIAEEID